MFQVLRAAPLRSSTQLARRSLHVHEHTAKGWMMENGIDCQRGITVSNLEDVKAAAEKLQKDYGTKLLVVKSAVLAGGRGKGTFDSGCVVSGRLPRYSSFCACMFPSAQIYFRSPPTKKFRGQAHFQDFFGCCSKILNHFQRLQKKYAKLAKLVFFNGCTHASLRFPKLPSPPRKTVSFWLLQILVEVQTPGGMEVLANTAPKK